MSMGNSTHTGTVQCWLKASRIQTAMVTALALWIGYVTVEPINAVPFIELGLIGLLIHVWGFLLNEIEDNEYDMEHANVDGHPIANGEISKDLATRLAWASGAIAIVFSFIFFDSILGNTLLLTSFFAGTAYNKFSKKHWWSNIYLSTWVLLLALSGAAFAGPFNVYTWILALALSIQIFVQVIEGDLKDILGPEKTMAGRLGVKCDNDSKLIEYPRWFYRCVNSLKLLELGLVVYVVYSSIVLSNIRHIITLSVFVAFASVFTATSTYYLTSRLDRDKIKKRSSIHELSSILMIGISSFWLQQNSAVFIAITPVIWYIVTNKLMHSGSINPDI